MNSTIFTKQLAAAAATNIALSQSPGAGAIILNGAATHFLSTTTTAAVAASLAAPIYVLPLTSTTGLVPGQPVSDSTAPTAIAPGTVISGVNATSVTLSKPVQGPGVGSGDTIVFSGPATIDTATAANSAIGRRVIITSGGNDLGINFTVNGTNSTGNQISDTFAGASGGAAQSNLDFVTVSSITHTGSVASTLTAGTNGVGSSPWWVLNNMLTPMNVGFAVELVSGAVTFTVQYTYDDPNNLQGGVIFPLPFNDSVLGTGVSATADGTYSNPVAAVRLYIASGVGAVRARFWQAGIG